MRAVITVVGRDAVGILAKVAGRCSEHKVNVIRSPSPFYRTCLR